MDMTEDQLQSMSEQQIRERFRCAPDYYLQAKLDKKRALYGDQEEALEEACEDDAESRWESALAEHSQWQASLPAPEHLSAALSRPEPLNIEPLVEPMVEPLFEPVPRESLDLALPGFEILDAALSETGQMDDAPAERSHAGAGHTQQAILEAALEDYDNWPIRSSHASKPKTAPVAKPTSELERKLTLVLDAEPELKLVLAPDLEMVLELEPELEVVLDSEPAMQQALESEPTFLAGNVTKADFGHRAPRTVPVVSVVMDRKRPNMVRVVGKSTRLAS
jgi:hypothetical protein